MPKSLPLGPLIVDIAGTTLSPEDREILTHPFVGGVILFTRNYDHLTQLKALIHEIRQLRSPRLLVTVDHEGGRVQRWHQGFTKIPPMDSLGHLYNQSPAVALKQAYYYGQVIARELVDVGVDLNYAPVLDVNYGISQVINYGRSFHRLPKVIIELASAYIQGLNAAGMSAIGKHFPGHGGVRADSHLTLPRDHRSLEKISQADLLPFQYLILRQQLAGIMTAHIVYDAIDPHVATNSRFWLQTILRQQLKFKGAIISDDLNMNAMRFCAAEETSPTQRVRKALNAGCDLILLCNNRTAVKSVLKNLDAAPDTSRIVQKLYARV